MARRFQFLEAIIHCFLVIARDIWGDGFQPVYWEMTGEMPVPLAVSLLAPHEIALLRSQQQALPVASQPLRR